MTRGQAATARDLVSEFEQGRAPGAFHHADHLRVAFAYVKEFPVLEAIAKFSAALQRFAISKGKPNLYHETITWAYLLLIHERTARAGGGQSWEEFAEHNPDLLAWKGGILERYYKPATLASELARQTFLFPDAGSNASWQFVFFTGSSAANVLLAWNGEYAEMSAGSPRSFNPGPRLVFLACRWLFHFDLDAHPRVDAALKAMFPFGQVRDLDLAALKDASASYFHLGKAARTFGNYVLTGGIEPGYEAAAELSDLSESVRLAALVDNAQGGSLLHPDGVRFEVPSRVGGASGRLGE